MPTFTPVGDSILVKPFMVKPNASSIIVSIERIHEVPTQQAEVVATGTGKVRNNGAFVPIPVDVGEKILYKRFTGREMNIDGGFYVLLKSEDIMAVMD